MLYKCADGQFARFSENNTRFVVAQKKEDFLRKIIEAQRDDYYSDETVPDLSNKVGGN